MSNDLIERIAALTLARQPVTRRTLPFRRGADVQITASTLDVDVVHSILTQADAGDARQLLSLYESIIFTDSHIQGEMAKRKLAVLGDPWKAVPVDPKNADDVAAAEVVNDQLADCDTFFDACAALLDGCLYPVVLIERTYRAARTPGLRWEIDQLIPVPMGLLYFDPCGPLRIFDVDESGNILGTHQMADPLRYIVHRGHLLGEKDHRGGPMRSLVFWSLFSAFDRDWWVRFLDKYGGAFMLGKYDQADDDSRLVLERAFALATRIGGIVVSRETEVEIAQAHTKDAGDAFELFHGICQKEKSKLIVGQTTSASAEAAGGLGSGVGTAQAAVRDDIRQFDRLRLANTLKHQLIMPFLEINGLAGDVTISFGAEAPEDTEKTSRTISSLANAGIELTDPAIVTLGERMGLPLQRKAAPASPLSGLPGDVPPGLATYAAQLWGDTRPLRADAANVRVASAAAADLAQAFRDDLAPLQRMLRESTSAADFEQRLRDHFPSWSPARTLPILEAGLTAFAANALP